MDLPRVVEPDDLLSQPTRARLFALLTERKQAVDTQELAAALRLHHNGVRAHLERMEAAGLVVRTRAKQARGRPRDQWTIAPDARPGGDPPSAYAELVGWLARAVTPDPGRRRDIEATGREIGREMAPRDGGGATDALQVTLTALGFAPSVKTAPGGTVTYCLDNCPYRDAAREHPEVICTLHKGLTQGLLDVLDPHIKLAGFEPRDPATAGCLIELTGVEEVLA
ncbi:MAG: helix-turn-helix domain-containing protein [Solirubrobacteraceae bacterium]